MSQAIIHLTTEGERWDNLAWRYYRNPLAYEAIIAANPGVPIYPVLPSGLRLAIPVVDKIETPDPLRLPPWLR